MQSFVSLCSLLAVLSATRVFALPYSVPNHAVNMTIVPRADIVKCNALTLDDAKKLPGWAKLEQYAKDSWGDGGWNIVTNPSDFLDAPANACVDDTTYAITPKGSPQCTTTTSDLTGTSEHTSGGMSVSVTTGQSTQGTWTVSESSSFSIGSEFSVNVGIEGLFGASASLTTTTTMENSSGKSFSTTTDNTATQTVDQPTQNGKNCVITVDVESCNQQGEGKVRIAATGWVWFNYDDARPPKSDPKGGKHYKYAASIEDVLSLDERSSWMSFTGAVKGNSYGRFDKHC